MASRTFVCGWEVGSLAAEPGLTESVPSQGIGAATVETSIVRSGARSLKVVPASGVASYWEMGAGVSIVSNYHRFYCRITVLPATTSRLLYGITSTVSLSLNSSGTITMSGVSTMGTSSTALIDTTRWYMIEIVALDGAQTLRIDGVVEASGTEATSHNISPSFGANDTVADTYTAYFDDAVADMLGFPGPGQVVLLEPTSLNAAGGWVEGDGAGTAGMAGAVSTNPPPGVASASETSATNIESPTNSATDNCDMNMTTYSAAGILGGVVNCVVPFVRHGEDIATGTKAGAALLVSNPVQAAEFAFNFGNDLGAHGAESGSWRTTVQTSLYATISNPVVSLGIAPVLRVGKRTATTRVVCVDFMGIYVDYTPNIRGESVLVSQAVPRLSRY